MATSELQSRHITLVATILLLSIGSASLLLYLAYWSSALPRFDAASRRFGNASCPKLRFNCGSSCVALEKRCDGKVDCPGAEDERNCFCAFRMPARKYCDKYPDCIDGSDENYCSYCPGGSFNCGDGQCIERSLVCDSKVDCKNFMDENFCFKLSPRIVPPHTDDPINGSDPRSSAPRAGFLLRNQRGVWYPVCANPQDTQQQTLASFACVSVTANPLAGSVHQLRHLGPYVQAKEYIYHYQGRFVKWHGCLTRMGLFIACEDMRCGLNPSRLLPSRRRARIVGGVTSDPGAWPWHAAIYKNGSYSCGATLISDRWLISAAHCFLNARGDYYEVSLGMLRRRSFTPHQKTYPLDLIVPHPRFSIITLEYDIVLLRTTERVVFDFWVRPICLPVPKRVETAGSYCTAVGWGDLGETGGDSDDLREVTVPLTKMCSRSTDRWLCAGFEQGGRDACQGDSGGPLMCLRPDGLSWYVAGVISGGTGCARPRTPGMYTRVAHFIDWMHKVMTFPANRAEAITPLSSCPGLRCAALGGGNCLAQDRVCDGHIDCYDAQEEIKCKSHASLSP